MVKVLFIFIKVETVNLENAFLAWLSTENWIQILDIFRDAERTASHMTNIVENFVFIREYMFYFEGKQHNTKFE